MGPRAPLPVPPFHHLAHQQQPQTARRAHSSQASCLSRLREVLPQLCAPRSPPAGGPAPCWRVRSCSGRRWTHRSAASASAATSAPAPAAAEPATRAPTHARTLRAWMSNIPIYLCRATRSNTPDVQVRGGAVEAGASQGTAHSSSITAWAAERVACTPFGR